MLQTQGLKKPASCKSCIIRQHKPAGIQSVFETKKQNKTKKNTTELEAISELTEGLKRCRITEGHGCAAASHGGKRDDQLLKRASTMSPVMKLNEAFMQMWQIPFVHS